MDKRYIQYSFFTVHFNKHAMAGQTWIHTVLSAQVRLGVFHV